MVVVGCRSVRWSHVSGWEGGDAVVVVAVQVAVVYAAAAVLFGVSGGCFVLIVVVEGGVALLGYARVALVGDVLEGVVDLVVHEEADRFGRRVRLRGRFDPRRSFCRRQVELAPHRVRRGKLSADPELLLEPVHAVRSFQSPHHLHGLRDGFPVSHPLDEVQQLTDDGGDAAAARDENDVIEGLQAPPHSAVRPVDESPVGVPGPSLLGSLEHFPSESTEWAEDEHEIPVVLPVLRREVLAAERRHRERMVLEDRDSWHPKVHVLARPPPHLGGDRYFDRVLRQDRHGGFVSDQPGELSRVGPVEVKETSDVRKQPNADGCEKIIP